VRVLIVEDEPLLAEAIRDGLRLEAIAAGKRSLPVRADDTERSLPERADNTAPGTGA
jgi:DNA-binding response OmpR family regulator